MKITLSNLSGHSEIFKNISNSDDFIKKIFAVTASSRKEPLSTQRQSKPSHACSLESIDSAYESDSESINDTKLLSTDKFKHKVNQLKGRLYKFYASTFYNEQDAESLITENQTVFEDFNSTDKEMHGYANFLYRYVKIPGININSSEIKNEIIKNYHHPKQLENKNGTKIPLITRTSKKNINNIALPLEPIKQRTKNFSQKKITYVHYKVSDNNQDNPQKKPLPKSTFEFKGNIQQTKTSVLRTQYIMQHYKLSNKSAPLDYKTQKNHFNRNVNSIKTSDLIKISNSIKKEKRLTMEMMALKDNIFEIQNQIHINDNLLKELKKQTIK
ncbi:hypothetical protein M0J40_RS12385 [Providencia rettgeri]|nr:hypothetical protein [Providencia rettgeri]ELR5126231.1 hypothetical protein [Providencia rettgeri]ELS4584422.1 hypothetical protein [Providencia rettgeri]